MKTNRRKFLEVGGLGLLAILGCKEEDKEEPIEKTIKGNVNGTSSKGGYTVTVFTEGPNREDCPVKFQGISFDTENEINRFMDYGNRIEIPCFYYEKEPHTIYAKEGGIWIDGIKYIWSKNSFEVGNGK